MSTTDPSREAPWIIGARGARANLVPGIALQIVAVAIACGYYFNAPIRQLLDTLSVFRIHIGFLYSSVSTAFFGGALPCFYLWLQPATRGRYSLLQGLTLTLFWAGKGIEVDLWYRLLAYVLGAQVTVGTVATKVILDQFGYSLFWAVPTVALAYEWVDSGFDFRVVWSDLCRPKWYQRRALPNLISNLGVWIPSVCVIYSLPTSLQIPLFNLVLCFYTLLLAHIAAHQAQPRSPLPRVNEPRIPIG